MWLLYYDINLTKYNLEKAWHCAIDPNIDKNENHNKFEKYQNTFGNANYLFKIGILFVIVAVGISSIMRHFLLYIWIERIFSLIIAFIAVCLSIILYRKLQPFYNDKLGIRDELFITMKTGTCMALAGIILIFSHAFGFISLILYNLLFCLTAVVTCNTFMIILTIMPKRLNDKKLSDSGIDDNNFGCGCCCINNKLKDLKCFCCGTLRMDSSISTKQDLELQVVSQSSTLTDEPNVLKTNNISNNTSTTKNVSWRDIVCTPFGYESLMNHLVKELSIENLLFISEVWSLRILGIQHS